MKITFYEFKRSKLLISQRSLLLIKQNKRNVCFKLRPYHYVMLSAINYSNNLTCTNANKTGKLYF